MSSILRFSPSSSPTRPNFLDDTDDDNTDTASQRSIPLSSGLSTPPRPLRSPSPPQLSSTPVFYSHEQLGTEPASPGGGYLEAHDGGVTPSASSSHTSIPRSPPTLDASPSAYEPRPAVKYPPSPLKIDSDVASMTSISSTSSRKARPESLLLEPPNGPLVPGIALVDFNHLVGPKFEFTQGSIFEDEEISKILPFLALPDGAHLSSEDYSYFHVVPSSPNPTTLFGISCNRQIKSVDLIVKDADVTRSTVQKAVVVLATKPLFGPIRDKLGVVTRALFDQRDFRETNLLVDFHSSLERSLRSQLTESGLYVGTNLRKLVHTFRNRTLVLLKALMLQKRIMFYGHPVERLCTYQYSLISLIPGLLQYLDDCGSPPLASRAHTLSRATSLRTSDRKSMLAYLGLPLDIFGKDAFFQPYLPLQQIDIIKETGSWLCGSTNSIVTQQKEIDLLVNIETSTVEFRDPKLERLIGLTAADRKWMDEIVKDVNEGWNEDGSPNQTVGIHFKGSEDYLRTKFEEYISSALASVKYADFLAKSARQDVHIIGTPDGGDANAIQDFNPLWISEFRRTNAFEVWNGVTDPMLFDICEARHPCSDKPNVVADLSLRLQEGIQDLKLEQQLAPTREAIARTISTGSTSFFKAVEGVRGRWAQRSSSSGSVPGDSSSTTSSPPVEVTMADAEMADILKEGPSDSTSQATPQQSYSANLAPLGVAAAQAANETKAALNAWGSGLGSFFSQKASRFSLPRISSPVSSPVHVSVQDTPEQSSSSGGATKQPDDDSKAMGDDPTFQQKSLNEGPAPHISTSPPSSQSEESLVNAGTAL